MKFWKSILAVSLFIGSLGFVSCSKKQKTPTDVNPPTVDIETPIDNNEDLPKDVEYLHLNVTYSSTELETGSVEKTVDQIYDSVVAIDAYMNNQHYGSGSGVLFGYDEKFSYIATCHHVIEECQGFKIILSNDEIYEAKLVGGDSESDIAVLSIEQTDLTYATWFDDTEKLKLGSSVICIGNPLGTLPGSVSTGVVSYNNRVIQVDSYHSMKLIQTDVAINSGNSGGGLFNSAGALIGIVNAKYSSSGIEGLGFAIPANQARTIIDSILKTAKYNVQENQWETGYVKDRWEIGFTLGYGGYGFMRTSIGIASAATNPTNSDYGKLLVNDKINAITLTYKDSTKEVKSLANITAQTTTIEDVYKFIYTADLSLGDIITFDITRGNENITIEVPLVQYIYSC
ncbi:MAG: trypsin-like peptidase domain-containing protein [Roseburia sp.]|nr:trypsin-like peptidase domain-containing protein [Anaeroplasma bactoclasticum]MCM1196680.1 trypsin-like peptidase domain-containing protein [Roseburia sp.]